MKKLIVSCLLFLCCVVGANAQSTLPVFTSITPNHTYVGKPMSVTITGKNFKSGMTLLISTDVGGQPMKTKVVNQYKATATVDGTFLNNAKIYRIYLLNRQGQIDSGEEYFQVCAPFSVWPIAATTPNPWPATTPGSAQFQLVGGCK